MSSPLVIMAIPLPEWRILAAYIIFFVSYFVFAAGKLPGMKIDRPGMAIIGAVAMVACRIIPPGEALRFIDFATIVLLFSMMLLVGFLHLAGFFDWIAQVTVRRLPPRRLLPAIVFSTGILSAFFVNDIICLVMVPFVLLTTRRMGLKPVPYLLAVATASNIGSVATITGNPQNMLIGSVSRISYRDFLIHLGPVAALGLVLDWLLLSLFIGFQPSLAQPDNTRLAGNPAWGEQDGASSPASTPGGVDTPAAAQEIGDGDTPSVVDHSQMRKPAVVIAIVVAGFLVGVPPAMMAALGAAVMLITRQRDPQKAYAEVNWDLLVFFVGLFLIVGGAQNAGLIDQLFEIARRWNLHYPAVFTAVTAVLSNIVSNVPAVMLLKTLIPSFPNPHTGWLLLAMASTLAGNLTITGSVANLIVVERARGEAQITFWEYFRVGLPVTILTLFVGWAWLHWVH